MSANQYDLFMSKSPKKTFDEGSKPKKETASMDEVREVFDHWNKQKVVVHRKLNDDMIKAIRKALKGYEMEEVKNAITYYAATLHAPNSYWTYEWPLTLFLTQKNAMPRFLTQRQCIAMFRGMGLPEVLQPPIKKDEEIF